MIGLTPEHYVEAEPEVTKLELGQYDKLESVDFVRGDVATTNFKRRARLHQSQWRERHGIEPGIQRAPKDSKKPDRLIGSRIALSRAFDKGENFLTREAREAARNRVTHKEPLQTLNSDRLYGDLLSSMPMCFNLFGALYADLALADAAVKTWWPDTPGSVSAVRFEWSPLRGTPGRFLGNRSAFDVAFELDMGDGTRGVIGVETKYHENCKPEAPPDPSKRLPRYTQVSKASGAFAAGAVDAFLGTKLQQIWLDHLLALSMLQDDAGEWTWAKFVLVHPERNPSYAVVARDYCAWLTEPAATFDVVTIESLLAAEALPNDLVAAFRDRYLW